MFATSAFLLFLVLPSLAWVFRRKILGSKPHWIPWLFVGVVLAGSLLYVGGVWLVGQEYEADWARFDLDGDGLISKSENTPEAQKAERRLFSDTGRSLAPLVAVPATLVWVTVSFVVCGAATWFCGEWRTWRQARATEGSPGKR